MSDEWVSVRARLAKDGKTISIANFLASHAPFQEWLGVPVGQLNRHALVSVTIRALIEIWAVGNARGIPDGDDIILLYTDFSAVDEICEVPGMASAMSFVHWLHAEEVDDVSAVRLPNFKEYNKPAEERSDREKVKREQNRLRQQRYRQRHNGSNAYVTANNAPTEQNRTGQTATDSAHSNRGVQGGNGNGELRPGPQPEFAAAVTPDRFFDLVDCIVSILDLAADSQEFLDQIGFLAKMAYADAAGFLWPVDREGRPQNLFGYIDKARVAKVRRRLPKRNSAGYLTQALREDLGEEGWARFEAEFPSPAHCHWLLRQRLENAR